ncbi:MAG TPA: DUF4331 family protein [Thermoleophilaceae bacterium]
MRIRRPLIALAACALLASAGPARADFRDGPVFADTAANGRLDVGPLYVFRSPSNANNTVFVMTVSPFTGVLTPATFVKGARYDIDIDGSGDAVADMVLRTTFGPPSAVDGSQSVLMRCLPKPRCRRYIFARGRTGKNISVPGGGTLRAGNQDIPDYFDQGAWDTRMATNTGFPRSPGTAKDFYGGKANSLAIVLEVPSTRIRVSPDNPKKVIGVWARTVGTGGRTDREGRPFVNTGLMPKTPTGQSRADRRNAFNVAFPDRDRIAFRDDMLSVLTSFYGRSPIDASFLADTFLPDMLMFEIGNPNGFGSLIGPGPGFFSGPFAGNQVLGNGRRLSEDVHDVTLNLLSNGAMPSDNVSDDNGLRITDGSVDPASAQTRAIAFPYVGTAGSPASGPNP